MDQILTIASLIQREGSNPDEVANIAAVIYNRLNAACSWRWTPPSPISNLM